jgi:hypothetical protein
MSQNLGKNIDISQKRTMDGSVSLGLGIVVVVVLIYVPAISNLLGPFWVLALYDFLVMASAVFAAYLASRLWRAYERGEMLSLIWGNIAVGLILWAAGEMIWSSDQLWGNNSLPYPSLADILWILGYLPIILALSLRLSTLKIIPNKVWQFATLVVYVLISVLAIWFIIVPIFTDPTTTRIFEKTINLLYPAGDLIVGFLAILLVMVLIGGTLFNSWGIIALGFFCAIASDLLYALAVWQGTFHANPAEGVDLGSFTINLLYVAFYVLVAIGLRIQAKSINAI